MKLSINSLRLAAFAALLGFATFGYADVDAEVEAMAVFDAFDDIWMSIVALLQGTFGRIVAALVIIAGVIAGIRTGNMMAFLSGAGVGVLMFFAPSIIIALQGQVVEPALMLEVLSQLQ